VYILVEILDQSLTEEQKRKIEEEVEEGLVYFDRKDKIFTSKRLDKDNKENILVP